MPCRLCAWLCDRLCPPGSRGETVWDAAYDWEEDYAADWEPAEPGDEIRARWREARGLLEVDPAAALAIHGGLAARGSPFSLLQVGWHHETGRGTERDAGKAEEFYRLALGAGSWKATLAYARLLYRRGAHDGWPGTLGDGVGKGFIPAFFWLAWYRHERSPRARTAREVRHLLDTAAAAGHPGARLTLARWTALGRFGLREIPAGIRALRLLVRSAMESAQASEAAAAAEPFASPLVHAARPAGPTAVEA